MAYIGSVITLWIVLAVLFGFALGWLARGRSKGRGGSRRKTKKNRYR